MKCGDWMCPNCNVVIFRGKTMCKKCKAIKPTPKNHVNEEYANIVRQSDEEIMTKRVNESNELIQKAISEGKPKLFYVTSCALCKNSDNTPNHNCWKYS